MAKAACENPADVGGRGIPIDGQATLRQGEVREHRLFTLLLEAPDSELLDFPLITPDSPILATSFRQISIIQVPQILHPVTLTSILHLLHPILRSQYSAPLINKTPYGSPSTGSPTACTPPRSTTIAAWTVADPQERSAFHSTAAITRQNSSNFFQTPSPPPTKRFDWIRSSSSTPTRHHAARSIRLGPSSTSHTQPEPGRISSAFTLLSN